MIRAYYRLAKPGIVYGNLLSTVAGFVLASRGHLEPIRFVACILGISLVMACACVLNNYLDRSIDRKMERTKNRASVTGQISLRRGIIYACVLGLIGFSLLYFYTNGLTTWIAFAGIILYVVVYGIFKRLSSIGTVVGSLSGAVPPLVGYVAVSNQLDLAALIIFLMLVAWQMPHFYAIAIFRGQDYAAAGIPVLPNTSSVRLTKYAIVGFLVAWFAAALALYFCHLAGVTYADTIGVLGLWWLYRALAGFGSPDDIKWARQMFGSSLVVLLVMSIAICLGAVLP